MLSLLMSSCTVLEDRDECPCWLKVSYVDTEDVSEEVRYVISHEGSVVVTGRETVASGPHMYVVPRDTISYSASFRIPEEHVVDHTYIIPEGQEPTDFYAFCNDGIQISSDYGETLVRPYKQHCNMLVRFMEDVSGRYQDMRCRVTSGTAGMDLVTLSPLSGRFAIDRHPSRDGQFSFRVPRQGTDDLSVTIEENGIVLIVYSLSDLLEGYSYDWSELSLKDVTVTLSLLTQEAVVELGDWADGGESSPEF